MSAAGHGRRLASVAILAIVLIGVPAQAGKKRAKALRPEDLPGWIREAATREVASLQTDVVWLHQEKIVAPLPEGGVRTTYRLAGKALGPSALDELASRPLYYVRGDDVVEARAWTWTPDGTVRVSDPDDDVSDHPVVPDYAGFDDQRVRLVRAPGVSVGAVVAYETERVARLDSGASSFSFGSESRPTALSRLVFRAPAGFRWEATPLRADRLEVGTSDDGGAWTGTNLAPLPPEDLRPPADALLPEMWVRWWTADGSRGYADWDAVGRWYEDISRSALRDPGEAVEIASRLAPSDAAGLPNALAAAFEFVARSIRYVSIDLGLGRGAGFEPASPARICRDRYGDCKDKTSLLRALVESWGRETYPVLVRTRDRGPLVEQVPTPGQFNHCIAAVRLPEGVGADLWSAITVEGIGRVVFLDATVRNGSPWALRGDVQGTRAFLVHPHGGVLVTLPMQPPEAASTRRRIEASVGEQGELREATLVESWTGTMATGIREFYAGASEAQHRRRMLADLQDRFPGAAVSDYSIEGLDDVESPVVETVRMAGGRIGRRVGDLLILDPGRFGYGVIGRPLPPPPRSWPLDVGLPREEIVEVTLHLPDGWVPEEIPEGMTLASEDIEAASSWESGQGVLSYRRRALLLSSVIARDRYAAFRERSDRVRAEDARAVVIVRSPS